MTVISQDVQLSPGAAVETYDAIEQPSYLAAVALTLEGRVLLVVNTALRSSGFHLNFLPASRRRTRIPASAMARELLEETGYKTELITLIGKTPTLLDETISHGRPLQKLHLVKRPVRSLQLRTRLSRAVREPLTLHRCASYVRRQNAYTLPSEDRA
jgi:NUDIX domain